MKFFKQPAKKCSVCGGENPTIHSKPFVFCKSCYDSTMQKVRPAVMKQVQDFKRKGKLIDVKDAKDITRKLTKQITQG